MVSEGMGEIKLMEYEEKKRIVDEITRLRDSVERIFGHLIDLEKRIESLEKEEG